MSASLVYLQGEDSEVKRAESQRTRGIIILLDVPPVTVLLGQVLLVGNGAQLVVSLSLVQVLLGLQRERHRGIAKTFRDWVNQDIPKGRKFFRP